jgi:hypothetical protein
MLLLNLWRRLWDRMTKRAGMRVRQVIDPDVEACRAELRQLAQEMRVIQQVVERRPR